MCQHESTPTQQSSKTSPDGSRQVLPEEEVSKEQEEEGGDVVERLIRSMEEQIDRDSLTDEAIELLRLVPVGYIPLPHQVGGHRHIDGKPGQQQLVVVIA